MTVASTALPTISDDLTPVPIDHFQAELAADVTKDNRAIDPKTIFARTDKYVYLVYVVVGIPANSSLEVAWVAVDVPGYVHNYEFLHDHCDCHPKTGEGVMGAFGLGSPSAGYRTGSYAAYLYLNGTLIGIYPFEIK